MNRLLDYLFYPLDKYDRIKEPWRFVVFLLFILPIIFIPEYTGDKQLQILGLALVILIRVIHLQYRGLRPRREKCKPSAM